MEAVSAFLAELQSIKLLSIEQYRYLFQEIKEFEHLVYVFSWIMAYCLVIGTFLMLVKAEELREMFKQASGNSLEKVNADWVATIGFMFFAFGLIFILVIGVMNIVHRSDYGKIENEIKAVLEGESAKQEERIGQGKFLKLLDKEKTHLDVLLKRAENNQEVKILDYLFIKECADKNNKNVILLERCIKEKNLLGR